MINKKWARTSFSAIKYERKENAQEYIYLKRDDERKRKEEMHFRLVKHFSRQPMNIY